MDSTFLQARIDATKAMIIAYENAATALDNGILSYTLNTGQTTQTVTKVNLTGINKTIESLYNRCATLEARLNGSGVLTVKPGW